jgi:Pyruvate/2-oxoacid:ferredoxin oxidoreductase delta subunit
MNIKSFFIKPSTEAFIKEARKTKDYSFFDLLHGLFYGRWTYFYISFGIGEHPLAKKLAPLMKHFPQDKKQNKENFRGIAETYHGKTMPLGAATRLVMVNEPVSIPDLEQVIPYNRARALVLQNPDHIVALNCPCRSARENPCLPLDVCLVIGEPFASFVSEHSPDQTRWITQDEAVAILKAEDERGHVHHAFFKDAMLGRFYAICNCCACCCGAMNAQRNGTPMLDSSGFVAEVNTDLCIGCGNCESYCQFDAISVTEGMNNVDYETCMGCGVCIDKCPEQALSLRRDPEKGSPLEIIELMEKAVKK